MGNESRDRVILIQRNGELDDFGMLLTELAVPVQLCAEGFPDAEMLEHARLVVVPGPHLLTRSTPNLKKWPRTLAVVEDGGKTLHAQLGRLGVAMVIRRPIHTSTLRLLLLHEIYSGPERRGPQRTSIGHPIRLGNGLFKRQRATLLELSNSGARIEVDDPPSVGSELRIFCNADLTQSRAIKMRAKVLRCIRPAGPDGSPGEIGVSLTDAKKHEATVQSILDRFSMGPAHWPSENPGDSGRQAAVPKNRAATKSASTTPTAAKVPERHDGNDDRRQGQRVPYDRRVVALGQEATKVLMGCDLSLTGMRVVAHPSTSVGSELRIALHGGADAEPLIVKARVVRNDREDGAVLSFVDLSDADRDRLEKVVSSNSPIIPIAESDSHADFESGCYVVGEVLANPAGAK